MSAETTVIFAGGGSGGHISPALAIAERLRERRGDLLPLFVCSERAIDREMLEEAGESFVPIPATPPALRPVAAWRFVRSYQQSRRQVRRLLSERSVACVVALGGFVAVPAIAAARAEGVPRILINLDAPPGKANRWMAGQCDTVLSAMAVEFRSWRSGPRRAEVVGMPIRRRAIAQGDAASCRTELGLDAEALTLMVTGASQGATSINWMMLELLKRHPGLFANVQVVHLAGSGAGEALRAAYEAAKVRAVVLEFLHEIGAAWGAADIAISRAGANSVAEVRANAVPTIFMPYPYHRDMHQRNNAQPLVDAGGALMVDDAIDPERNANVIAPLLAALFEDQARRSAMRKSLQSMPRADAADRIAKIIGESC